MIYNHIHLLCHHLERKHNIYTYSTVSARGLTFARNACHAMGICILELVATMYPAWHGELKIYRFLGVLVVLGVLERGAKCVLCM